MVFGSVFAPGDGGWDRNSVLATAPAARARAAEELAATDKELVRRDAPTATVTRVCAGAHLVLLGLLLGGSVRWAEPDTMGKDFDTGLQDAVTLRGNAAHYEMNPGQHADFW